MNLPGNTARPPLWQKRKGATSKSAGANARALISRGKCYDSLYWNCRSLALPLCTRLGVSIAGRLDGDVGVGHARLPSARRGVDVCGDVPGKTMCRARAPEYLKRWNQAERRAMSSSGVAACHARPGVVWGVLWAGRGGEGDDTGLDTHGSLSSLSDGAGDVQGEEDGGASKRDEAVVAVLEEESARADGGVLQGAAAAPKKVRSVGWDGVMTCCTKWRRVIGHKSPRAMARASSTESGAPIAATRSARASEGRGVRVDMSLHRGSNTRW